MKVFTENIIEGLSKKPELNPVETAQTYIEAKQQPEPTKEKTFWDKVKNALQWIWDNGSKIIGIVVSVVGVIKGILYIRGNLVVKTIAVA